MRTSKATFIPGRTIFSLETLTKIIESVLGVELVECTEEHFRINGDPGGFAYRKARGVVSCLGLTLAALEKAPREELIDAIMNVVDLKKAFNTTKRSTVVEQAQIIAGAGKLMMTRWLDRTYTFEGEVRGHEYNRGTDAGAVLAVWGFDRWINTDTSCQTSAGVDEHGRPIICQPCNFSDDRNPSTRGSNVENGLYQFKVLTPMKHWAIREDAEFHVEGPKKPGTLIFSQIVCGERTRRPNGVDSLTMCDKVIDITDQQKVLGVVVATKPYLFSNGNKKSIFRNKQSETAFRKQAEKLIDKFGYFLQPDLSYLINSAYRFHQLRDEISPHRMWLVVNSYFLGKLRFAMSLHFLRCTEKQLNSMRFYYGMSMAAILNISSYEALGAACCDNRAVKKNNVAFKRLCDCLKMPTLEQIAAADAKTCLSQMAKAKQDWFLPKNRRARSRIIESIEEAKKKGKTYLPEMVDEQMKGTLIGDLLDLALNNTDDPMDVSVTDDSTIVSYRRNWDIAMEALEELSNLSDRPHRDVARNVRKIYRTKSLHDIGALEMNDRRTRRRTPSKPLIPSRVCKVYPPDVDGNELLYTEHQIEYVFNCSKKSPCLWLDKDLKDSDVVCVACGDLIKESELKRHPCACNECGRILHSRCQRKLKISKATFKCSQISRRIVPVKIGSSKLRDFECIKPKVASGCMRCLVCGELNTDPDTPRVRCDRPGCSFSCHEICLKAHNHITSLKHGVSISLDKWCCDDIKYWIDSTTATKINDKLSVELLQAFIECFNIEPVKQHNNPKKRRYDNHKDDLKCVHCNEIIPLEQDNHLWSYCSAFKGSPPSKDPMECVSRIKRRCLEISGIGVLEDYSSRQVERDVFTNPSMSYRDAVVSNPTIVISGEARQSSLSSSSPARAEAQHYCVRSPVTICSRDSRRIASENENNPANPTVSTRHVSQNQSLTLTNRFAALATQSADEPTISVSNLQDSDRPRRTTRSRCANAVSSRTRQKRRNRPADETDDANINRGYGPRTRRKKGPSGPTTSDHILENNEPIQLRRSQRIRKKRAPNNVTQDASVTHDSPPIGATRPLSKRVATSNNTETVQKTRGQNYRLENSTCLSDGHSEEPRESGAPGRSATPKYFRKIVAD